MSRQKKDQKVDTIKHQSGASVDLMLNPNSLTFSATIMEGLHFAAKSAEEVRMQVVDYLNKNVRLEWTPVIEISEQKPFATSDHAFIGIETDRFYLTKDATGNLLKCGWEDFEEDFRAPATDLSRLHSSCRFYGFKDGKISLPYSTEGHEGQTHYIYYSEAAWVALEKIREAISSLKSQLREIFASESGMAKLIEFGERALRLLPCSKEQS